ncbi:major facilitator superfamily protein [Streptomyces laurentii]|uniref:Major facilitator superfamily protein n=1 Tax=Streptomyces laurentii TaxID=39478 RepID=A0A169N4W2_STRLU|nr:major facilitator superfamily protein [Streptomyces laurentii]
MSRPTPWHRTALDRIPGGLDGRRMLVVSIIEKTGTGLWASCTALYFTYVSGLGLGQVGFLLTVSGGVGIAGAPLAGRFADRFPLIRVIAATQLLRAVTLLALLTTNDFALLTLYSALGALPDRAGSVLVKLYAARVAGADRVRYQAIQRTTVNIGWSIGGLGAAAALATGSSRAYALLLIGNVVGYVVIAALTLRCAEPPAPTPSRVVATGADAPRARPGSPWRDRVYVAYTATEVALFADNTLLQVAVPLWIVHATAAPAGLAPLLLVLNTVLVVLFQVPLARFGATARDARRLLVPLGGLFLVGTVALTVSAAGGRTLAITALVVSVIAVSFAEIIHATSSWELSVALAPPEAQGSYVGFHGIAQSAQRFAGPLAVTGVMSVGALAWPVLGLALVAAGAAQHRLIRDRVDALDAPSPSLSVPTVTVSEH